MTGDSLVSAAKIWSPSFSLKYSLFWHKLSRRSLSPLQVLIHTPSFMSGWQELAGLRQRLAESLRAFVECVFAYFCWKPYKSRLTLVLSFPRAGWLLLKALWKHFKKRANCDNTNLCDKIAYVGGPSFRRRPWPSGDRWSHNFCHLPCSDRSSFCYD